MKKRAKNGDIDKFLAAAIASNASECIFWPYAKNSAGYGHFQRGEFRSLAHRYVCEAVHGKPFAGAYAAHHCGNGHLSCVNPKHLSWKTAAENSADTILHGRTVRGRHPNSKLTAESAAYIKRNAGQKSANELGKELGVSRFVVYQVIAGNSWKWVDAFAAERGVTLGE